MATTPLPIRRDITIYRGRHFRSRLYRLLDAAGNPIDLTGLQIAASLAKKISQSATEKIYAFTIERDDTAGEFSLTSTDTQNAAIDEELTGSYYDIEITDANGEATQFAEGKAKIEGTVTA